MDCCSPLLFLLLLLALDRQEACRRSRQTEEEEEEEVRLSKNMMGVTGIVLAVRKVVMVIVSVVRAAEKCSNIEVESGVLAVVIVEVMAVDLKAQVEEEEVVNI